MIRLGVDFGGTKIEVAALGGGGEILARRRGANPGSYEAALACVRELTSAVEADLAAAGVPDPVAREIGVGVPGSLSPATLRMRNANSTWLNGRPLDQDLAQALRRPVRLANDANCFALSEAADGAGAGARVVFGLILGTGCGGGLVVEGELIEGRSGVAGEIGHLPLPWPSPEERGSRTCWCGKTDCLETFLSGPALGADYAPAAPTTGAEVAAKASGGEPAALAALERYMDRLARGLALIVNLLDPEVVVLGGGLSNISRLYQELPQRTAAYVFSDVFGAKILPPAHGDSSGVRGAAWLWPERT